MVSLGINLRLNCRNKRMLNEISTNDGNYSFTIDVCCLQTLKPTFNILDTSLCYNGTRFQTTIKKVGYLNWSLVSTQINLCTVY